jgi:hypothetical protein
MKRFLHTQAFSLLVYINHLSFFFFFFAIGDDAFGANLNKVNWLWMALDGFGWLMNYAFDCRSSTLKVACLRYRHDARCQA